MSFSLGKKTSEKKVGQLPYKILDHDEFAIKEVSDNLLRKA